MCGEPDYVYTSMTGMYRKARKDHTCYACADTIKKGYHYHYEFCTGGDDGPEYYKHCMRCWEMLSAIIKALPDGAIRWDLNCGLAWEDEIGELPPEVARLAFMTPDEAQQLVKRSEALL